MQKAERIKGFQERNKRALWIFKLEDNYKIESEFNNYEFNSDWLKIWKNGQIEIPKDYAWDGCSFKFNVLDLFIIGTPDGIINIKTMKPKTYFASLVHDALYQYYGYHGISRKKIDRFLLQMMKDAKFILSYIYYFAVRMFGWIFFITKRKIKVDGKVYFKNTII